MLLIRVSGRCPGSLVEHCDGERHSRAAAFLLALPFVLLICLVVIPLLAYAGPPDPTWISGIYDNADYDDVVGLVTDGTGASNSQWLARVPEGPVKCAMLLGLGRVPSLMVCVEMTRGPPPIKARTRLCSSQPPPLYLVVFPPPHAFCVAIQRQGPISSGRARLVSRPRPLGAASVQFTARQ